MVSVEAPFVPAIKNIVRYHVPGVISHVQRIVLQHQQVFASPGGAETVLAELNRQAAGHGVRLLAVVIRRDRYDALIAHTSAKGTGRFLCMANKLISSRLRPKEWTCTLWDGDRPGVDLATDQPAVWADKLADLLQGADVGLLDAVASGLAQGSEVRVRTDRGPVLLVQVLGPVRQAREKAAAFFDQARERVERMLTSEKTLPFPATPGMPGDRQGPAPARLRRRLPNLTALLPEALAALQRAWSTFQLNYRAAAEKLKNYTGTLSHLGFPRHCFGPPVPTPQ